MVVCVKVEDVGELVEKDVKNVFRECDGGVFLDDIVESDEVVEGWFCFDLVIGCIVVDDFEED